MAKDPGSQNVQMHVPPGAKQNGHGLTGRTAVRNGQDHIFLDAIQLESDVPDTGPRKLSFRGGSTSVI